MIALRPVPARSAPEHATKGTRSLHAMGRHHSIGRSWWAILPQMMNAEAYAAHAVARAAPASPQPSRQTHRTSPPILTANASSTPIRGVIESCRPRLTPAATRTAEDAGRESARIVRYRLAGAKAAEVLARPTPRERMTSALRSVRSMSETPRPSDMTRPSRNERPAAAVLSLPVVAAVARPTTAVEAVHRKDVHTEIRLKMAALTLSAARPVLAPAPARRPTQAVSIIERTGSAKHAARMGRATVAISPFT